ncbi:MAG: hypothetical protein Q8Q09_27015 [Deltaproteobacteria bacterium]|nr:hypothetical protein [Deltaproteobacteria bacterium]
MTDPSPSEPTAAPEPATPRVPKRVVASRSGAANAKAAAKIGAAERDFKKYLPYIGVASTIGVLALLVRTPRFASAGCLAIGCVLGALLLWLGHSYRVSLPADDKLRWMLTPITAMILAVAFVPFARVVFPPPPVGVVQLSASDEHHEIPVNSATNLWIDVSGRQSPTAVGLADYTLALSLDAQRQRVAGRLRGEPGDPVLHERNTLAIHGPGTLRVELRGLSSAIATPITVQVHGRLVPTMPLLVVLGALWILAAMIDTALYRRGVEPSYAAAMGIPLIAVAYYQLRTITGESMPTELAGGALLGAILGGLGGEVLARIGRMLAPK